MASKTFELAVLVSVLNDSLIHTVTEADKNSLVNYIHGENIANMDANDAFDAAQDYIRLTYPKVTEAANLIQHTALDQQRYFKLIDLFGMNHVVKQMEVLNTVEV